MIVASGLHSQTVVFYVMEPFLFFSATIFGGCLAIGAGSSGFYLGRYHGLSLSAARSAKAYDTENRLVHDLLEGYNKWVIPKLNNSYSLKVRFGLSFIQLLSISEKSQVMKSNVWLTLNWRDFQLQWNPSHYNGIKVLRIPVELVWQPDIVLMNNADGILDVIYKPNVVVTHDGSVLWMPPAVYQSTCTIELKDFPFDVQVCPMKFASWTFPADQVEFALDGMDFKDFVNSGTFDIESGRGVLSYDKDACPPTTDATFHIAIRRKSLFYMVHLILPTAIVSFLNVSMFFLPSDAKEKAALGINLLLSLIVFLTMIVKKFLPPSGTEVPLIAKYLLWTYMTSFLMLGLNVVVSHVALSHVTGPTELGYFSKRLFKDIFPRLLRMSMPSPEATIKEGLVTPMTVTECGLEHSDCIYKRAFPGRFFRTDDGIAWPAEYFCPNKTVHSLHQLAKAAHEQSKIYQARGEKRYVAMVIDRLLLVVFFVTITAGSLLIAFYSNVA